MQTVQQVTVLLATFNGERFLNEQIESILNQERVRVEIYVNDDGSTDRTPEILAKWTQSGHISKLTRSDRNGPTRAFLKLLALCEGKEFVAFSDGRGVT